MVVPGTSRSRVTSHVPWEENVTRSEYNPSKRRKCDVGEYPYNYEIPRFVNVSSDYKLQKTDVHRTK